LAYSLHIHRRTDWSDRGQDITLAEWQALCEADPTLDLTGVAVARNPSTGEEIAIRSEGMARWDGPVTTWFEWTRGQIGIPTTDATVFAKVSEIAAKLGARVQGDEGEFYGPDGSFEEADS
jgi:hypothetical protein